MSPALENLIARLYTHCAHPLTDYGPCFCREKFFCIVGGDPPQTMVNHYDACFLLHEWLMYALDGEPMPVPWMRQEYGGDFDKWAHAVGRR